MTSERRLLAPTSGRIQVDGTDIVGLPPDRIVSLGVSLVPEGRRLFTGMSVRENLEVGARLAAARVGPRGAVEGLDPNSGMLAIARDVARSGPSIVWHEAPAEAIPLPDDGFDVVLCGMGLQFFSDRLASLREMHGARQRSLDAAREKLEGMLAAVNDKTKLILIINPNNPTGTVLNIEPDGRIRACPKVSVHFGNVFRDGLRHVWERSSEMAGFRAFWIDYCKTAGFEKGTKHDVLCPAAAMLSQPEGLTQFRRQWQATRDQIAQEGAATCSD